MQIPSEARTDNTLATNLRSVCLGKYILLIGANQSTILCRLLVVREQMTPMIQRHRIARRTVCNAFLKVVSFSSDVSAEAELTVSRHRSHPQE